MAANALKMTNFAPYNNKNMNKKAYQQPSMTEVEIMQEALLNDGSVQNVTGNASLKYGGSGHGPARSGSHDGSWDDEE